MANEEYMIRGVKQVGGNQLVYEWSHVKTSCSLTPAQAQTLRDKGSWLYMVDKNPADSILVSKDIAEQTSIETDLDDMSVGFTTTSVTPTEFQKKLIAKFRVGNRGQVKKALAMEATQSAFDAEVLKGKTEQQIKDYIENNITDLPSAKVFLKKFASATLAMAKYQGIED